MSGNIKTDLKNRSIQLQKSFEKLQNNRILYGRFSHQSNGG